MGGLGGGKRMTQDPLGPFRALGTVRLQVTPPVKATAPHKGPSVPACMNEFRGRKTGIPTIQFKQCFLFVH